MVFNEESEKKKNQTNACALCVVCVFWYVCVGGVCVGVHMCMCASVHVLREKIFKMSEEERFL